MLKQTEVFASLAIFFLIGVFAVSADLIELEQERNRNPPIIILTEQRENFRFPLGSATPTAAFRRALSTEILPLLDSLAAECHCDGVEIVGHTDGVEVRSRGSNLDSEMVRAMRAGRADRLRPGSNIDLGMMRALAVMAIMQEAQRRGSLSSIAYWMPYSAGQLLRADRQLVTADDNRPDRYRRRIEIRLLRTEARPIDAR